MQKDFLNTNIIWDSHCCIPLLENTKISTLLKRHYKAGFNFVCINIGMDMISVNHILRLLECFRAEILTSDYLLLARSANDIQYALDNNMLAVGFGLEGGLPFLESEYMVGLYSELGIRQALLAYNRNNILAGGCADAEAPLSSIGKKIIRAMKQHGIMLDCSHTGFKSSMDIMEHVDFPVIFSHATTQLATKNKMNLRDEQIISCAKTGGVVCISGLSWFLGEGFGVENILRHIEHTANIGGIEHVGIGLDYAYEDHIDDMPKNIDLNHWWPNYYSDQHHFPSAIFPPEGILEIQDHLAKYFSAAESRLILGGNMLRVAQEIWPSASFI